MPSRESDKILDALNSTILCLDNSSVITYANANAEVMFSASAAALRSKNFTQLLSQIETSTIESNIRNFATQQQTVTEHEAQITLSNGQSFIADYSIYALDDLNRRNGIVIEIRPLQRQVEIALDTVRNMQKQVSQQFARGVAHEIKNPLGGIRGAAQLLEKEISQPDLKELTDIIISEVDRLQVLVDNMMGPRVRLERTQVNILEILEHIRKLLETAEPHKFNFYRDYDPSIPEILADRGQLIQAFLNIALNAVQALGGDGEITFKTRIDRHITIGKVTHPLVVLIDIIDNGKGISPDLQETIFLPMVTDKAEGSGLGLPIAQEIISRHGGIVKSESTAAGTIFHIIIPLELP